MFILQEKSFDRPHALGIISRPRETTAWPRGRSCARTVFRSGWCTKSVVVSFASLVAVQLAQVGLHAYPGLFTCWGIKRGRGKACGLFFLIALEGEWLCTTLYQGLVVIMCVHFEGWMPACADGR
jgi:hypothetical protein